MKTIKGDLILTKDYSIEDNLIVEGNIICKGGLWNINALDINAGDINARNINAWDINAGDINAWDINALDIKAGDINAKNINYYAICYAYKNIKCKSIKGRRNNCKHFCLDGEIKIIGEQTE
jgi:hypothetical protein